MTTKKAASEATPRRYHAVLTDGERTITAAEVDVRANGALVFLSQDGGVKVAYPPGGWRYVELETQDE